MWGHQYNSYLTLSMVLFVDDRYWPWQAILNLHVFLDGKRSVRLILCRQFVRVLNFAQCLIIPRRNNCLNCRQHQCLIKIVWGGHYWPKFFLLFCVAALVGGCRRCGKDCETDEDEAMKGRRCLWFSECFFLQQGQSFEKAGWSPWQLMQWEVCVQLVLL